MVKAIITRTDISMMPANLIAKSDAELENLQREVEAAVALINQADQTPLPSGLTPAVVGGIRIKEAKRWYHCIAYGRVNVDLVE